jgi:hypothetical protein
MSVANQAIQQEVYLTAKQVRARYGNASAMWITRRLANDGFPAPLYIAGSRFWRVADLDLWDAAQIAKPRPQRVRDMAAVRSARLQ